MNLIPVWYPKAFNASVNGQHIRYVPVIKPKPRRVYQNCPVVRMVRLRTSIRR